MVSKTETEFKWKREHQVQELLQLGRTSLYKLRRDNLIRWSVIGGSVFYDIESINEYLEANSSQKSGVKK